MTNRDLLTEAIADAKAVKETAIANAKLALEEAFTPYLKNQLSAKLEEMDKDDDEVKEAKEEDKDEVKEMDAPSFERKNSPAGDSLKDLTPKKVGQSTVQEEEEKELSEDEVNLDELLAELELDEDARTDAEEEGYKDGMKDEKEDEDDKIEDEDIDLEDMSEDDLKGFIEDVIKDMVESGEIEPGDEFVEDEVEVEDVEDIDVEDEVSVDVEIDEAKKEELDEKVKGEKGAGNEDGDKDDTKIEKETEKMRFKEALDEIEALKVELQEVNLLNAKLLYTNKIFKAKNLTESKKVKVLKAFDKAINVEQAKTIFETLNEGITSTVTTPTINESVKKGSASKASGLEPKATKQPIVESNDIYNRMQKLAGLI
jgi:hypothetical protein